jgi:integrase
MQNSKNRKVIKIKTRRNILNGLHVFFVWLHDTGEIDAVSAWPEVKGDDAETRTAVDYEDQEELTSRIPEAHRDVYIFGNETGLRSGELCALRICDIDLKAGTAKIQRTLSCDRLRDTTKGRSNPSR